MGCDIHTFVEVKKDGKWEFVKGVTPFDTRNYGIFGLLADVRNYSRVPVIAEARGLPGDLSPFMVKKTAEDSFYDDDGHSASWLLLSELLEFDYAQTFENRRTSGWLGPRTLSGSVTCDEGEGENETLRDFLGYAFFADLTSLETLGEPDDVRVVFFFDN